MSDWRSDHACDMIKRNGRDYIVVMGGLYGPNTKSIEFYDLTLKPNSWEVVPGIALPGVASLIGWMIHIFDEGICEVFVLSALGTGYTCTGNYTWSSADVQAFHPGRIHLPVVDANLLGGDTVW